VWTSCRGAGWPTWPGEAAQGLVRPFFESRKEPYALVGGLALLAYGAPRATFDVDLQLEEQLAPVPRLCRSFPPTTVASRRRPSVPIGPGLC